MLSLFEIGSGDEYEKVKIYRSIKTDRWTSGKHVIRKATLISAQMSSYYNIIQETEH